MAQSFDSFIGRERTARDTVDLWRMQALDAALGPTLLIKAGAALPLPYHFCLFPEAKARSEMGQDGHPSVGGFMPPVELPRRMFAGAKMRLLTPLVIGEPVERTERILSVTPKEGASGRLCIVAIRSEYVQHGRCCLSEERDIIYREASPAQAVPPDLPAFVAIDDDVWADSINIDTLLLFRFSALTYNGHRIHYDRDYARFEEGYPDLIVQGPLLATLLCRFAHTRSGRPLREFRFRAQHPMFLGAPVRLRGGPNAQGGATIRAMTADGKIAMQAEVNFEDE